MSKPTKVLVTVLSGLERGGWLNPRLALSLLAMQRDARFSVDIEMVIAAPVAYARNVCMSKAREKKPDWLLSLDNDIVTPCENPLDLLAEAPPAVDIFAGLYGVSVDAKNASYRLCADVRSNRVGNFLEVEKIGAGMLFIKSSVWTRLPKGPWFKWVTGDNELLSGEGGCGEDFFFCQLARASGFKVWASCRGCGHLKTADVTALAMPQH